MSFRWGQNVFSCDGNKDKTSMTAMKKKLLFDHHKRKQHISVCCTLPTSCVYCDWLFDVSAVWYIGCEPSAPLIMITDDCYFSDDDEEYSSSYFVPYNENNRNLVDTGSQSEG
jgi:hypothetical protein